MITIGVDTGGTFTDFIFKQGDAWGVYKAPSTPVEPESAILEGLHHVAQGKRKQIIHGSTVATNAILERKGAKTALITNKGFEDIIEIGRQNRNRLYDLTYRKEPHIVPSNLRFGVQGRILHTGEEYESLDIEQGKKIVQALLDFHVESVAVCFLFSFANPSHEQGIKELMKGTGIVVSLSHEVLSEFREFERTSTTVLNAYVSPKMQTYIRSLQDKLSEGESLRIMQSNGGSISAETAMNESVRTILSGPAGGAVGAFEIGNITDYSKIITFDMGGTSTDVSLIDETLTLTMESRVSDYPIKVPMIDIHTVGAGGGSIACLDVGGALKVGPESAGADPGPVCYGKGNQITVTDANLYMGRLIPEFFLGGTMRLKPEKIKNHLVRMANESGLSPVELSEGILSVVNATMEKAIRVISVERGYDPREFVLFAFGGAGGMHAAFLARLLNIPKVLVPQNPGILSAMGMLMADVIKDYSVTVMENQYSATTGELSAFFLNLEKKGLEDLFHEGFSEENIRIERYLDMRYEGQSYEIIVPFAPEYTEQFHVLHEKNYGYHHDDKTIEIVNVRLRAVGIPEKPWFKKAPLISGQIPDNAFLGEHNVVFDQKATMTPVITRDRLLNGNTIVGPAMVVEYSSTIVIPPFAKGFVDEYGNIIMDINA